MIKRGEWYYLVYANIGRRGMPTCIGYSMSKNIIGPYEYKGVIVDNFGCDPYVWNNHGSIAEFNGQWYVFYHRSTNGCERMRSASVRASCPGSRYPTAIRDPLPGNNHHPNVCFRVALFLVVEDTSTGITPVTM